MSQSLSLGVSGVASWDLVEEGMAVQERAAVRDCGVLGFLVSGERWSGRQMGGRMREEEGRVDWGCRAVDGWIGGLLVGLGR